jgi:GTP-dependent phosphoenolpyruvate carboxykinase
VAIVAIVGVRPELVNVSAGDTGLMLPSEADPDWERGENAASSWSAGDTAWCSDPIGLERFDPMALRPVA